VETADPPATIHPVTNADGPRPRGITLSSGLRLHCVHWSDPSAEGRVPIVLVHGLASNARLWDAAARELAALGHGVLAVDQRGHGLSDKPDDGYDMATVADDLAELVSVLADEDARWRAPLVVGQSWGGNVVVELAARHPRAVRGVCAVDGGTIQLARSFPDWETCAERLTPPRLVGTEAGRLRSAIAAMHPDWPEESVAGVMHNMEVRADGTIAPWLTLERHMRIVRALWDHDPVALYPHIEVPVMFTPALASNIADDHQRHKHAQIDEAQRLVPRCRVEPFVDADHDLHAQQPARFAAAIEDAILGGHFPAVLPA